MLGLALIKSTPKNSALKLNFLNFGWENLAKTKDPSVFMDVAIVLVEFAIKNMKSESVNMFISEIFKRFKDFVLVSEDEDLFRKLEVPASSLTCVAPDREGDAHGQELL